MEHLDHPSPHFNDAKMARFCGLRASLLWRGRGLIVPFYSVQDCSYYSLDLLTPLSVCTKGTSSLVSIDTLDRHPDRYLVDTHGHLISSRALAGRVSTDSYASTKKIVKVSREYRPSVDGV